MANSKEKPKQEEKERGKTREKHEEKGRGKGIMNEVRERLDNLRDRIT